MEALLKTYTDKLIAVEKIITTTKFNGSTNDKEKIVRLKTQRNVYKEIVDDIEAAIKKQNTISIGDTIHVVNNATEIKKVEKERKIKLKHITIMTPEKKVELLSKIPISGEIIDKAIELGYLGLNDLEKDALKPWVTFLVHKVEGKCGPLYIETSITKEDQVVSFNYQNSLSKKPVDSKGNSNGYYASWFSFTIGRATARRMKLPYKKV